MAVRMGAQYCTMFILKDKNDLINDLLTICCYFIFII